MSHAQIVFIVSSYYTKSYSIFIVVKIKSHKVLVYL